MIKSIYKFLKDDQVVKNAEIMLRAIFPFFATIVMLVITLVVMCYCKTELKIIGQLLSDIVAWIIYKAFPRHPT